MKQVIITLALIVSIGISNLAFGQGVASKLGHINSGELLSLMPEFKDANEKLKAETESLKTTLEGMYKEYQTKRQEVESQYEQMDDLLKETKVKELQDTEKRIAEFEASAQQKIVKLEAELLRPAQEKATNAVNAVAEKEGFTYIIDIGAGAIVYIGKDAIDILPQVKAQLGIQ